MINTSQIKVEPKCEEIPASLANKPEESELDLYIHHLTGEIFRFSLANSKRENTTAMFTGIGSKCGQQTQSLSDLKPAAKKQTQCIKQELPSSTLNKAHSFKERKQQTKCVQLTEQKKVPQALASINTQMVSLRINREHQMFQTKVIAKAVEVASIIPEAAVVVVSSGVHLACTSHSQARRVCQASADIMTKALKIADDMVPYEVKSGARNLTKVIKSGVKWYVESDFKLDQALGIPVSQTKIHHQHLGIILSFGANRLLPFKKPPLEKRTWINLFQDIGYKLDKKGGKGSHQKLVHPDHPVIIIPQNITKGLAHQFSGIYEWALKQTREVHGPIVTPKLPGPPYKIPEHRMNYSRQYELSRDSFIKAKEFDGVLKHDLLVARFHDYDTNYKWFMPVMEANKHMTIKEVADAMAKLRKFGDITQVTVARIPAGERVKFLHGRASPQIDKVEVRVGGGVQYRFYDFDLKWILQTRDLPK